jgi:hypothetical protein
VYNERRAVSQWRRMFKSAGGGGRTNVHNEERSGRSSAVSDDIVQNVDPKRTCGRRRFTIQNFRVIVHKISRTLL